jgi:hypothetical protein
MSDREPIAPLPAPLREEARRLRSLEPSPEFRGRLHQALIEADAATTPTEQAGSGSRKPRGARLLSGDWLRGWVQIAAVFMPILATAGVLLHFLLRDGLEQQTFTRYQAIDIRLDGDGDSWLDFGLVSQHHKGRDATLRIEVPSEVTVVATSHSTPGDESPICDAGQCTYRFHQPAPDPTRVPLQIGVRSPGQYKIRIEHVSPVALVQEEILVQAREDAPADSGL